MVCEALAKIVLLAEHRAVALVRNDAVCVFIRVNPAKKRTF
jgi:hypothetical protein